MKIEDQLCGCTPGKPLHELKNLIEMLERQQDQKQAKESPKEGGAPSDTPSR